MSFLDLSIPTQEREAKLKSEKIKIALEKMKAASVQELFVKVYNSEQGTNKTMMIDDTWTSRKVSEETTKYLPGHGVGRIPFRTSKKTCKLIANFSKIIHGPVSDTDPDSS